QRLESEFIRQPGYSGSPTIRLPSRAGKLLVHVSQPGGAERQRPGLSAKKITRSRFHSFRVTAVFDSQSTTAIDALTITSMTSTRPWDEIVADLLVEVALFLCSYAPLFAILAIRFRTSWLEALFGSLAAIGLASGIAVVVRFSGLAGQEWRATRVED